MLEFKYATKELDESPEWSPWPFVYLYGQAEEANVARFDDGGNAPDICVANELISEYHDQLSKTNPLALPCMVEGQPGVAVLQAYQWYVQGRIALLSDFEAVKHCYSPEKWR